MGKVVAVVLLVLCSVVVFSNFALAASIGSSIPASEKEGMGISVGVEDNFVFDRDIKKSGDMTGGEVEESNQASVIVNFQPFDFMTAYLKLGTANLEEKFNWNVNRSQKIKFDYGFLGGGGINLLYNLGNNFGIGWDNQLLWWHTDADSVSGSNTPRLTKKGSVNNYDFQSTAYLKYDLNLGIDNLLTPYVGGCYSSFKSKIDKGIEIQDDAYIYTYGDAENDDNFGAVAGVNYRLGENLLFGVEGRFISETAVTGSISYKF